jgi:hypothetical protein
MKKKVIACAAVLAVCGAWSLLCHDAAFAQAGMTTATPPLGATSSFGIVPGESVGPNGLPLGASPGVSTVPNGLTGTITVPSASSGAACSTVATSPEGTFGSPTTYDGGGMAGATTTGPASAATPGSPSMPSAMSSSAISTSSAISATSGTSVTSGTLATSGLTGMCGSGASSIAASSNPTTTTSSSTAPSSGARAGIPLGSYEIGNLGVSAAPSVPITNLSPFAATAGANSPAPTMPAVAPPIGSSATPGVTPAPSTIP